MPSARIFSEFCLHESAVCELQVRLFMKDSVGGTRHLNTNLFRQRILSSNLTIMLTIDFVLSPTKSTTQNKKSSVLFDSWSLWDDWHFPVRRAQDLLVMVQGVMLWQ